MSDNFPTTLHDPLIWQDAAAFWWVRRAPCTEALATDALEAQGRTDVPSPRSAREASTVRGLVRNAHS